VCMGNVTQVYPHRGGKQTVSRLGCGGSIPPTLTTLSHERHRAMSYVPNKVIPQQQRVYQSKFVTGTQVRRTKSRWSRTGKAVRKDVPTDFESTYREFINQYYHS